MKKIISLICVVLFYGCIFTYDPPPSFLYIYNNSKESVYVYLEYGDIDSLPLISDKIFFGFIDAHIKDAYETYAMSGKQKKPLLPEGVKAVTLFFITEKTMRSNDLKDIYKNQMFAKKITLTEDDLKKMDWKVVYDPDSK